MATVTLGNGVWNTTAGDKTTGSFSLAANDLIIVFAGTTGLAGGTTAVTDTRPGGTYTQIGADRTTGANTGTLTAWVRDGLVPSTLNGTVTASQTGSTGGGLVALKVAGMTKFGTAAIRQSAGVDTGSSSTTPTPVFSVAALTTNAIVGSVMNASNPAALTPRSSPAYSETNDAGYASPAAGIEVMTLDSGETATSIAWGGTSASAYAAIVVELDTSATANFVTQVIMAWS